MIVRWDFVPEGRPTIAHRFIGGCRADKHRKPRRGERGFGLRSPAQGWCRAHRKNIFRPYGTGDESRSDVGRGNS